jgi:hypothetical protein
MKIAAALLTVLLSLTACGGSSDNTPTPKASATVTTTTPAADPSSDLKAAVHAYSKAYLTGDGASAYAMLTKRCRTKLALSEFAAASESAKSLYGNVPIKTLDVKVNGTKATATYTYAVATINQTDQPWVFESGAWHYDQC